MDEGGREDGRTGHSDEPRLPVECRDADLWAVLMEGGGEPVTPHKTRRSLPSQASGKLMDEQERRNRARVWDEGVGGKAFFKNPPKNEEKVFSILKHAG